MKRILIFSVAYHPFVGGAEVAVKEITDRISDTEIQFDMITLNLDGNQRPQESIGNVKVYRIGGPGRMQKLLFPFTASRLAVKLHKENPYTVTWSIMASFSGFAALLFKFKYKKVPFILTLQEGDPIPYIERRVLPVYFWFQQIFIRADFIQTISHYLAGWAKSKGTKAPIVVIPNGVDTSVFTKQQDQADIDVLKVQLKKKEGDKFLITTSRLVKKNGVGDVIAALPLLPENIKFIILGIGELEDKLKRQVKVLHLDARVQFLGHVEYKNIPQYLAVSDIFIRPSLSEGMGNSFIEAMAARIPVIATPVGGIPDFLLERQTGVFCIPHNPASIAEAVTLLLDNHDLHDHMVKTAYDRVIKNYDWSLIAERMKSEIFAKV